MRVNLAEVLLRAERHAEALDLAREALQANVWGPDSPGARIVLCQAKRVVIPPVLNPDEPVEGQACRVDTELADEAAPAAKGMVTRPEKIFGWLPSFPNGGKFGEILLEAVIDEEGCVRNIRVCQGLTPAMDRLAQETLSRWVFQPASLEARPVAVYFTLTVKIAVGP